MRLLSALLIAAATTLPVAAYAEVPPASRAPDQPLLVGMPGADQAGDLPALAGGVRFTGDAGRLDALRRDPRRYSEPRRYGEPRRYAGPRGYRTPIVTQLAGGFYSPGGPSATSFLLSARAGPQIDPHVQLGFMLDWAHKSDRVSATFGQETVGGVDLSLEDSRLRGRSDLVPLLAFVQVSGNAAMGPVPYAGFGAGYEILAMEADRPDGTRFDGTFGGWGWQLWAGAGLPISNRARLSGELFFNHADLGRDVNVDGRLLRQTASFNGPGMRFGVAWGF